MVAAAIIWGKVFGFVGAFILALFIVWVLYSLAVGGFLSDNPQPKD